MTMVYGTLRTLLFGAVLSFFTTAAQSASNAIGSSPQADFVAFLGPALAPALAPGADKRACPTVTNIIYLDQLINQTESSCKEDGVITNESPGLFGRNTPFGFTWMDQTPTNCSIYTVTVALQAGISCTGLAGGGNITINRVLTNAKYRFPYGNEYPTGMNGCSCTPPFSPIQVLSISPSDGYCQGCKNSLSILGSNGSNGLRPILSNVSGGIYGAVIINQWTPAAPMSEPRTAFGYVTTPRGKAFATGGYGVDGQMLASADEYNLTLDSWLPSRNSMKEPKANVVAANLQELGNADSTDSYYCIAAGGYSQNHSTSRTVDIYNTTSQTFLPGPYPDMANSRAEFQLTSLYNFTNEVIASGGLSGDVGAYQVLETAEIFDFDQNNWQSTGNLSEARYQHQAVLIPDTQGVIAFGGLGADGEVLASSELFNYTTLNWTMQGNLNEARVGHQGVALLNGTILAIGGSSVPEDDSSYNETALLSSCEVFINGTWSFGSSLNFPRANFQAEVESDGSIFISGGIGQYAEAYSEIFNPATQTWVLAPPMLSSSIDNGLVRLANDHILTFGGAVNSGLGLTTGTSNAADFTPAFNLSSFKAILAPAVAPALSPSQAASVKDINATGPSVIPFTNGTSSPSGGDFNVMVNVSEGLSNGAIGGIVAGCIVGAAALTFVCFYVYSRKRQDKRTEAPASLSEPKLGDVASSGSDSFPSPNANAKLPSETSSTRALLQKLSFGIIPSPKQSSQRSLDAERGLESGASPYAATERSVALGGSRGKLVASPFDTPSTLTPLTTKGSQNTSITGDPITGTSAEYLHPSASGGSHGASAADVFNASSLPLVHVSDDRVSAGPSNLSRVSLSIMKELSNAEWRIDPKSLVLGQMIGKGGFGEVYEATHHGSEVAVKVLQIKDERTMLDACHEFGQLHNLRHSKLVVSYGASIVGNKMMLVMERMETDLFRAISSDETGKGDSVLYNFRGWKIAVDIASALVFLHTKGLVHLDIKSLNILLGQGRNEAKLADLGLARLVKEGNLDLQHTLPGTPAYSAPEVMRAQIQWRLRSQGQKELFSTEVGTPADIFAFGVVLFELCTGSHPARWRQEFRGTFRGEEGPPAIADLVDQCLDDNPAARPTAKDVLNTLLANKPNPNF